MRSFVHTCDCPTVLLHLRATSDIYRHVILRASSAARPPPPWAGSCRTRAVGSPDPPPVSAAAPWTRSCRDSWRCSRGTASRRSSTRGWPWVHSTDCTSRDRPWKIRACWMTCFCKCETAMRVGPVTSRRRHVAVYSGKRALIAAHLR